MRDGRRRWTRGLALAATLAGVGAGEGAAHDYWMELTAFRPAAGARVGVRHFVGEKRIGNELPRVGPRIVRFDQTGPAGETAEVPGRDGLLPAGWTELPGAGLHWIAYESTPASVELAPELFASYLAEEGLGGIGEERARRGEADRPAREAYSRHAKAAACVGEPVPTASRAEPLGLELELTPTADPCAYAAGRRAGFELRFHGVTLPGALVQALAPGGSVASSGRTDRRGRIDLEIDRPGIWVIKAVHMTRAEGAPDVEWRSYWASLSFEVPR